MPRERYEDHSSSRLRLVLHRTGGPYTIEFQPEGEWDGVINVSLGGTEMRWDVDHADREGRGGLVLGGMTMGTESLWDDVFWFDFVWTTHRRSFATGAKRSFGAKTKPPKSECQLSTQSRLSPLAQPARMAAAVSSSVPET